MAEKLLTTKALQDLLQLDRVTIYKLVKEGELPALRVGGQWRFSESAVTAWLSRRDEAARTPGRPAEQPGAKDGALRLSDLMPSETLQSIQNQFAQLLGVASLTIDNSGIPYVACSHCSEFCQIVHTTASGFSACKDTWRVMARAPEEGAQIYQCHAGVHYASAPIIVNGEHVGIVTAGQFLTQAPDADESRTLAMKTAERIGVDGEFLAEARASLEIVSTDRALQITGLLATIANTLSAIGYQGYLMRQKLAQIAHISSDNAVR